MEKPTLENIVARLEKLEKAVFTSSFESKKEPHAINFGLNERAFIKRFSRGMTKPQKFALRDTGKIFLQTTRVLCRPLFHPLSTEGVMVE